MTPLRGCRPTCRKLVSVPAISPSLFPQFLVPSIPCTPFALFRPNFPRQLPAGRAKGIRVQLAGPQPAKRSGIDRPAVAGNVLGFVAIQRDAETGDAVLEGRQKPARPHRRAGQRADAVDQCAMKFRGGVVAAVEREAGEIPEARPSPAIGTPNQEHPSAAANHHRRFANRRARASASATESASCKRSENARQSVATGQASQRGARGRQTSLPNSINAELNRPGLRRGRTASAIAQPSRRPTAESTSPR